MKNIWLMTKYTLREALAKKVFIFFIGFSVISLIILALVTGFADVKDLAPMFGKDSEAIQKIIINFQMIVSGFLGTLLIFLAVFSSANFISSLLEKGTVDLFLSKPLSRSQILWGKFTGGVIVFLINILIPVIGSWLIISMKFGYYNFNFLWIVITYSFTFAVLYSIVIFFGVITRSSFPGIMTSYFIFVILSQLLYFGNEYADKVTGSIFLQRIIQGIYYFIPKTYELLNDTTKSLMFGSGIEDFQPVISSLLFLILIMYFANYFFGEKDY